MLQSELKEREQLVISTLEQARMFLAEQPIEGPGEPRKNLQPKTGWAGMFLKPDNTVLTARHTELNLMTEVMKPVFFLFVFFPQNNQSFNEVRHRKQDALKICNTIR